MAYTNFAQFVGYYITGGDLVLKLSKAWSTAAPSKNGGDLVIVTQPAVRRSLHIMNTPLKVTIGANDERLQAVLALNSVTARNHVAKFDLQAKQAKESKQGRELLKLIASLLAK